MKNHSPNFKPLSHTHIKPKRDGLLLNTVRKSALSAVISVLVLGHEDTGTTLLSGALLSQSGDLSVVVDTVELEYGEFHSLVLVLDHLGSGVHFLLSLLSTSSKSENKMKGSLLRDVVVAERTSVLELRLFIRFVSNHKKLDLSERKGYKEYIPAFQQR